MIYYKRIYEKPAMKVHLVGSAEYERLHKLLQQETLTEDADQIKRDSDSSKENME